MRTSFLLKAGLIVTSCIGCVGCGKVSPPSLGGGLDVVVLCSSCTIPQDQGHGYIILLDQRSGKIWAYGDLRPGMKPILLGALTAVGEPVTRASLEGGSEGSMDSAVKQARNQACAVGSLRTINTAEVTFASTYPNGFSQELGSLGGNCRPSTASCAGLIDGQLASGVKCGYRFTYLPTLGEGARVDTYFVYADPLEPAANHYYTDKSGVIRQNTDRRAGPNDPPLAG